MCFQLFGTCFERGGEERGYRAAGGGLHQPFRTAMFMKDSSISQHLQRHERRWNGGWGEKES